MFQDGDLVKVKAAPDKKYQDREVRYGTVTPYTHVAPSADMLYVVFPGGFGGFYKADRLVKCNERNWNVD